MTARRAEWTARIAAWAAVGLLPVAAHVPVLRRRAWRAFYELFAAVEPDAFALMNYGYAGDDAPDAAADGISQDNEGYAKRLYDRVVAGTDLTGKDVLEVGCGRGGGAAYLASRSAPRRVVGMDIAPAAITLCRRLHAAPNLSFAVGDAMALPVAAASFDAVVNIESAFCYPSRARFYAEARRVLRPGGRFLYADIEATHRIPALENALREAGFAVVARAAITRAVVRACDRDAARRKALIAQRCRSRAARALARNFAAVPGTVIYRRLADGRRCYMTYTLEA